MAYSDKVLDHYENPRNVGKMNTEDEDCLLYTSEAADDLI